MKPEELVQLAKDARARSYVPYSGFAVGAALLCKDGKIYQGCNIENAAFGPTICAERVAVFKAVYDGEREFEAIAWPAAGQGRISPGSFRPAASAARCCGNSAISILCSTWQRKTANTKPGAWAKCSR